MPQRTSHHVKWNEYWGRYRIESIQGRITYWPPIIPGTEEWFAWLQEIPSFAFRARDGGHFTARKETRARGGAYWIAYRHISGQLVKRYIGPPAKVSTERLEETASDLEMRM
jgi:LuxR family maltose regulon positive regulatory protein